MIDINDARKMFEENIEQIRKCKSNNDIEGQRYFEGKNDTILTLFAKDKLFPPKICKTWSELYKNNAFLPVKAELSADNGTCSYGPYVDSRSAIALLKMRQLIDRSYGGLPKISDFDTAINVIFKIEISTFFDNKISVRIVEYDAVDCSFAPVLAFNNLSDAENFLAYGENLYLIREYFCIPTSYKFVNDEYNILEDTYIKELQKQNNIS